MSWTRHQPGTYPLLAAHSDPSSNPDRAFYKTRNLEYPWKVWWCLAAFFCLVSAFQLSSYLYAKYAARSALVDEDNGESGHVFRPRSKGFFQRLPSAIINSYRVIAFRSTVDFGFGYTLNITEVVLTILYIIALFTWSFIYTTDIRGNKLSNPYWSNRTGTIATSQFPLITALGTKNNLISYITGISYDKLNYMHRMTSRVTFVLIWVHGIGRILKGVPSHEWEEAWLRTGMMAGVGFTIICIISVRPLRAKQYELFFYVHFFLVLAFLIGGYYHARYRHFDPYMIACFIIWGLDRLIRLVRLVTFYYSYFGWKSGSGTLDAQAELLSGDMVRLTLRRPPHFHWRPGQSAYLIMPSVSTLPFEAHPFTIASFDSTLDEPGDPETGIEREDDKDTRMSGGKLFWKELVFLVSPQDGCTRRLLDVASRKSAIKVFVDGPYGPSPDLRRFDTSILISGGSGVTHTLPVFLSIIEKARRGKTRCAKVVFIWAIRNIAYINWVYEALERGRSLAPPSLEVIVKVFITSQNCDVLNYDASSIKNDSSEPDTPRSEKTVTGLPNVLNTPGLQVSSGRPDLKALLHKEVEETQGRMVVSVCGSQSIAKTVKSALSIPFASPERRPECDFTRGSVWLCLGGLTLGVTVCSLFLRAYFEHK